MRTRMSILQIGLAICRVVVMERIATGFAEAGQINLGAHDICISWDLKIHRVCEERTVDNLRHDAECACGALGGCCGRVAVAARLWLGC